MRGKRDAARRSDQGRSGSTEHRQPSLLQYCVLTLAETLTKGKACGCVVVVVVVCV